MVQKQDGPHFVNHWKTEQTPTIGILNMFGMPAPTVSHTKCLPPDLILIFFNFCQVLNLLTLPQMYLLQSVDGFISAFLPVHRQVYQQHFKPFCKAKAKGGIITGILVKYLGRVPGICLEIDFKLHWDSELGTFKLRNHSNYKLFEVCYSSLEVARLLVWYSDPRSNLG